MSQRTRKALAAVAGAGLIAGTLIAVDSGQATAEPDRSMHFLARDTTSILYIPCPTCVQQSVPAGAHIGGTEVNAGYLLDPHGAKVGHFTLYAVGATPFTPQGPGELMLNATLVLAQGQITTQGVEEPPDDHGVTAIVGGTGAYATARGEVRYTDNADGSTNLDVRLSH
jgi:hypothetical protein